MHRDFGFRCGWPGSAATRDDMKAYKKEVRDSLQQGVPGLKPKGMICDLKDLVVNTTSSVEIISYLHYDNGT